MKKKVSKRGGYRPGAGAKKTGRNTTCISFSVHKDFAELIKSMVKSKVAELKQAAAGVPLPKDFIKTKKILAVDAAGKKHDVVSEYLKSRRSKKLGLKD